MIESPELVERKVLIEHMENELKRLFDLSQSVMSQQEQSLEAMIMAFEGIVRRHASPDGS